MTTKLEALCQLADANAALAGSGFVRPVGLKLTTDDIAALAAEFRHLMDVSSRVVTAAFDGKPERSDTSRWTVVDPKDPSSVKALLQAKPDADGWIRWKGDPICPVLHGQKIEVCLRCDPGVRYRSFAPENLRWAHTGDLGDIVAYRLARD